MTITVQAVSQTCSASLSCLLSSNVEIKPVSQWYTKYRSMSITVILQLHKKNKFLIPHLKTKHDMNLFFPRAIRLWNELPTEIKDAPTVPAFASGLNKLYAFN